MESRGKFGTLYLLLHIKFYWDTVKLFVYKLSKAIVIQQEQGWAIATETLPLVRSNVFTNFYRKSLPIPGLENHGLETFTNMIMLYYVKYTRFNNINLQSTFLNAFWRLPFCLFRNRNLEFTFFFFLDCLFIAGHSYALNHTLQEQGSRTSPTLPICPQCVQHSEGTCHYTLCFWAVSNLIARVQDTSHIPIASSRWILIDQKDT